MIHPIHAGLDAGRFGFGLGVHGWQREGDDHEEQKSDGGEGELGWADLVHGLMNQ